MARAESAPHPQPRSLHLAGTHLTKEEGADEAPAPDSGRLEEANPDEASGVTDDEAEEERWASEVTSLEGISSDLFLSSG